MTSSPPHVPDQDPHPNTNLNLSKRSTITSPNSNVNPRPSNLQLPSISTMGLSLPPNPPHHPIALPIGLSPTAEKSLMTSAGLRLKRHQACTNCRAKKTRCDADRPICHPCLQAALSKGMDPTSAGCIYDSDSSSSSRESSRVVKKRRRSAEDIGAGREEDVREAEKVIRLEERVARLEKMVTFLSTSLNIHFPPPSPPDPSEPVITPYVSPELPLQPTPIMNINSPSTYSPTPEYLNSPTEDFQTQTFSAQMSLGPSVQSQQFNRPMSYSYYPSIPRSVEALEPQGPTSTSPPSGWYPDTYHSRNPSSHPGSNLGRGWNEGSGRG